MKLLFEKANFFSVIANEREATQLVVFRKARWLHCALSFTIIWVASRSLAMTDEVKLAIDGFLPNTTACLAKK